MSPAAPAQVSIVVPITSAPSSNLEDSLCRWMCRGGGRHGRRRSIFSVTQVSPLCIQVGFCGCYSKKGEKGMRTHVHSLHSLAVSLGFIWGRALQSSPCSLGSRLRSSPHCKGAATHCDPLQVHNRCKPGISTSQQSGILYKCDKPNVFGVYETT